MTQIYDLCQQFLAQVQAALASTPSGAPDRACVTVGQVAWDQCECGQLVVTTLRQYVTETFPASEGDVTTAPTTCRVGFVAADILISMMRCAPQPIGQATAPTCDALAKSADEVLLDAWTILSTIECYLVDLRDANQIVEFIVRNQPIRGPQGGCVGSDLEFTVAVEWD